MYNYLILVLSWTIFYAVHSLLASSKIKRFLKEKLGPAMKWYRLFYSFLAFLLLMGIGLVSLKIPTQKIIPESSVFTYFGYMAATFGTIILVKSSKAISLLSFLGFKSNTDEKLIDTGWYARVRHPLYLGLMLIFLGYFLVAKSSTSFIHFLCLIVYLPAGIYFEEQNLIVQFGNDYKDYQKRIPAIFPKIKK